MTASELEVIGWSEGKLWFLDQTLLPGEERRIETDDPTVVADAIRRLAIRGAPLIGIAAAFGFTLGFLAQSAFRNVPLRSRVERLFTLFAATRPTAVNLFKALERVKECALSHSDREADLERLLLQEAQAIHEEEKTMCREIARNGSVLLLPGSVVVTHCNTGALATGGKGTALGVIREAWERGALRHVYIDETRPLLQGARLTTWELQKLGIPSTLITDSTAAFLMLQNRINVVVVGADRIAANGDTANKIGTYALALAARHHGIPFYVAAPTSTLDLATPTGKEIPIEVRGAEELVLQGLRRVAPEHTEAYSPAFDVTPADLIMAVITDRGIARPPYEQSLAAAVEASEKVSP
ncbi:MAG: S-methyl-5-thioribose-1-phosphate isomerase [Ignavibacteriales bacterium]|nr:S-methyl-5-thioribose-1-phosphate isomerase [Ignavibacteriales bacterium]